MTTAFVAGSLVCWLCFVKRWHSASQCNLIELRFLSLQLQCLLGQTLRRSLVLLRTDSDNRLEAG